LIITIIVIIILAAIVMSSGGNTISQANYASFAQQFGEFADQVKIDAATVMAETGKNGKSINNAQKFHMVANGYLDLKSGDNLGAYGFQLPVGYVIPESVQRALGITTSNLAGGASENDIVAYLITDQEINGYETRSNLDFYGDSNGKEHHFVTSDGVVFTIPGFQEEQEDGSIKYYVNSQGAYYTVVGKSDLTADATAAIEADPILARDFTDLHGVDSDGIDHDDETYSIYKAASGTGINLQLENNATTSQGF
jgi:type II secretory pathway pseudopilin PulG